MRKIALGIIFTIAAQTLLAQPISFFKSYGGNGYDYGRDVVEDFDDGYVCTGSSSSFLSDQGDLFVMKVDTGGHFKWSYNYGGEGSDWGESILFDSDTNYSVAGYTNSIGYGGFDFYFLKIDSNGTKLLEKTYGGADWDKCYAHIQLQDSGYVMVGDSYSFGNDLQAYIVRTDKWGDTLWTKSWGGIEEESLNDVILDGDSIVVCGRTTSFGNGEDDGLIIKMDLLGNIGWSKTIGQERSDYFNSIEHFNDYYVLGGQRSYNFDDDKEDMWVYKIQDDGLTVVFDSLYADSEDTDITMDLMIRDVNQDIIIAGFTKTWGVIDGFGDMITCKYTSNFTFVTNYTFGADLRDQPFAIKETSDDGYIMIGDFNHQSSGGGNMFLLKNTYLWEWFDVYNDIENEQITTSINNEPHKLENEIYPNPFQDQLTINLQEDCEKVEILSINGAKILEVYKSGEYDLGHLESGIYIVNYVFTEKSFRSKIVKN